jgi:hypothetical protein
MTTVAIVAARDRIDTVAATVTALSEFVDRIVVVDDGSHDGTAGAAAAAGATVVVLPRNRGKGGAVTAGVEAAPDADVYLLVDADTGATAPGAVVLLDPVRSGVADMAIGVLPGAGRSGGFGLVRRIAAAGIRRASGFEARAPLSGQRAVRGDVLRRVLPLAHRFGLETALTIDARRRGARVVEVDVDMGHRATGRSVAGFRHRAGQGRDIVRALWPRVTTARQRIALMVLAFVVLSAFSLWSGGRTEPASVPAGRTWSHVVLFDMSGLKWSDLDSGRVPNYDHLVQQGAIAATSVRTRGKHPSIPEGWATVGAGTRVSADSRSAVAFNATAVVEGGSARDAALRRTGTAPTGQVLVLGAASTVKLNAGKHLSSAPGALGDALHAAGKTTGATGNGDAGPLSTQRGGISRPAALGVMDHNGSVDFGTVGPELLQADAAAPFGHRAAAVSIPQGDVVAIDPGDMERAIEFAAQATPTEAEAARVAALESTDQILGEVAQSLPPDTLLLVTSVAPAGRDWHLQPLLAVGAGVPHGELHSPSVRRAGIVTITDIAPTVLAAVGAPVPDGMIGHALRFRPGSEGVSRFPRIDRDAGFRESYWFPLTVGYIIFQSAVYVVALAFLLRPGGADIGRLRGPLRWVLLGIAGFPLASFLYRAIPNVAALHKPGLLLMGVIDAVIVAIACRFRRHPLSPLSWVLGATVAILAADIATGARLQTSSLLGYSLHTAARFTGIGNSAFAALAASALLVVAIHMQYAPRRREALVFSGLLFAFVVLIDGAPSLGNDVGGILTLVPIFAVTMFVLGGRRLRARTIAIAAGATIGVLALATGVDLLRPADARTHLGRFASDLFKGGGSDFTTTVSRKLASNMRTYSSVWCWIVVIIAFYALWLLVWRRGWTRLLPAGSALRVGVVGTFAAGIFGNLLNDSGVVVTALVFVYLGPFLTMLALELDVPDPVLLEPAAAPSAAVGAVPAERVGSRP